MTDRQSSQLSFWHPASIIGTWFGVGLLPYAPGTWGSLAALPFGWAISTALGQWNLVIAAGLLFGIGIWASKVCALYDHNKDPKKVVVDEVVGQWLVISTVPPDLVLFLIGFFLFRFFDIVKTWPANAIDRHLKGGLGIMLDDVIAAIYSAFILWLISLTVV